MDRKEEERMRIRIAIVLALVGIFMSFPTLAEAATPVASPTAEATAIHGTITATGRYIFQWVDGDVCTLAFWDYDFTPELIVQDEDGRNLATLQLANLVGKVAIEGTGEDRHAESCAVSYEIGIPKSDSYRVLIDPYFESDTISSADLNRNDGYLDISFERQEEDDAPNLASRPSGAIIGTDKFRIAGIIELFGLATGTDANFFVTPFGCVALGGFDDIATGAQITVRDESGTIIGVGELEPIYLVDQDRCVFTFTVDVPSATFYTVEMGRRGSISYSRDELDEANWQLYLSING
jgi:hypothetical protein